MGKTKDSDAPAADLGLTIKLHSRHAKTPDQYEVLVGAKRVAYVCVGERAPGDLMPINWIPPATTGLAVTTAERIAIAKAVRELMKAVNDEAAAEEAELRDLAGGDQ